jgi:hypothetical protein
MGEPTMAELEQRFKEAAEASSALTAEHLALTEAQLALHPKIKAAMVAEASARAAWETARRGGPLEPEEVAEALRQAGRNDPERLFAFERAGSLAALPYAVWVRPLTRAGQQLPRGMVWEPLLEAGYEVRLAHEKRYRLEGETATAYYPVTVVQRPVLEVPA